MEMKNKKITIEEEIKKLKTDIVIKVFMANMQSKFTGRLEVWFEEGYAVEAKNTQNLFAGISSIDQNKVTIYNMADK
jgi:hypothetical protein